MPTNPTKIFLRIVSFIISVIGFTLVTISYLPTGLLKIKIIFPNENIYTNFFTLENLLKLRFIGIAIISIIFLCSALIDKANKYFHRLFIDFYYFSREIFSKFLNAIQKENKIHIYSFIFILILATIIRYFYLFKPIYYEEAFNFLNYAQKPLFMGLSDYSSSSNQLLNTLFVHISYKLFGNNLWAIRLPSLIFGILMILISYLAARIFYEKNTAILSTGIIASSWILIEYSTQSIGYIIIAFFFLTLLVLAKYILYENNLFAWMLLAILSAIGFYTTPSMLYSFGIIITWLILSILSKDTKFTNLYLFKKLLSFIITTIILTLLLYLPVIIRTDLISIINNRSIESMALFQAFTILPSSIKSIWIKWTQGIPIEISIFFLINLIISLILHKKIANHKIPIIYAIFIYSILYFLIKRDMPNEDSLLFLLPIYIIISSSGIIYLMRLILFKIKRPKTFIYSTFSLILTIALGLIVFYSQPIYYSSERNTLRDAEEIAIMLKDNLKEGDKIISKCPSDAILIYYFKKNAIKIDYFEEIPDLYSIKRVFIIVNKTNQQKLNEVLNSYNSSFLLYYEPKLFKEYDSAYIYKSYNLRFRSNLIIDFSNYTDGEFQHSFLSEDNKEIITEEASQTLKLIKIPIEISSNKDYVITFKIKKVEDLDNIICFDFSGKNYDEKEQEFTLEPEKVNKDYARVTNVLSSSNVPSNTDISFRIFTYSGGGIIIKDLEIYELE